MIVMLPELVGIRQILKAPRIDDVRGEVERAVSLLPLETFDLRGKRIGITAGSRGISEIDKIISTLVSIVKKHEGIPFVVAAMGSHGGATAEGQREMLASLGITEESVGAPIICHAEAGKIGKTPGGVPVYCNSEAKKLDGLIICNRIKSHTDFSEEIESGLCKMMTIGLGNHKGASTAHYYAVNNGYMEMIRASAEVMMEKLPILFGVGIVENWKNETMEIQATLPQNLIETDKNLLELYKKNSLKLPFKEADVLIVGELGKNISGSGMDTKVIGRIRILGQKEPDYPKIENVIVLGLTEESHGNATGIGLADYTTKEVYDQIDLQSTTINGLTSMAPGQIRLPVILDTEQEALEWACKTLGPEKEDNLTIAYIKNTMALEEMAVSKNMFARLTGDIQIIDDPKPIRFDEKGKLVPPIRIA
jgi:hypothetical protein